MNNYFMKNRSSDENNYEQNPSNSNITVTFYQKMAKAFSKTECMSEPKFGQTII